VRLNTTKQATLMMKAATVPCAAHTSAQWS